MSCYINKVYYNYTLQCKDLTGSLSDVFEFLDTVGLSIRILDIFMWTLLSDLAFRNLYRWRGSPCDWLLVSWCSTTSISATEAIGRCSTRLQDPPTWFHSRPRPPAPISWNTSLQIIIAVHTHTYSLTSPTGDYECTHMKYTNLRMRLRSSSFIHSVPPLCFQFR